MRLPLLSVAVLAGACVASTRYVPPPPPPPQPAPAPEAAAPSSLAVAADAGVEAAEVAWLVAHLADHADPAHPNDSDSVRRLAQRGAVGVRAVAEVFRHGDARRAPFARRVIERVALQSCRADRPRAVWTVVWLQAGRVVRDVRVDGPFVWNGADATRWETPAVERLRQWADQGLPCGDPEAADADGGRG